MTNFYPYYINTGLFEGFTPKMAWILPTLKADYVAQRMHSAIMAEEKEVYIWAVIWYLKVLIMLLPLGLKNKLCQILIGDGMEYFVGRSKQFMQESKKTN